MSNLTGNGLEQLPMGRPGRLAVPRSRLLAGPVLLRRLGGWHFARLEHAQRRPARPLDRADAERPPLRRILEPMRLGVAARVDLREPLRLDPHPLALEQPEHAGLAGLRALVLAVLARRLVVAVVGRRLLVGRDVALVVAEHDLVIR